MRTNWNDRNIIVANLLNPAFCGEILRIVIKEYNKKNQKKFPFALVFLVLPLILHKATRDRMPKTSKSYFFVWIEQNDDLFFDFSKRTKDMVKFTKEAIIFLLLHKKIIITELGEIASNQDKGRLINQDFYDEYNEIIKKSDMLGKWLANVDDVKSIYSFFKITP